MLRREDWLDIAKSLPIGMRKRVQHGNESRQNLIIENKPDRYVAYCQSCREGGVVDKEHVRFVAVSPEAQKSNMTLPLDMQPVMQSPFLPRIAEFLASKNMDMQYLSGADLLYSQSRKRLILRDHSGYMGRDITGDAKEKWLTYSGQHFLAQPIVNYRPTVAVVTEDTFSFHKVQHALSMHGYSGKYHVYCSLGTGLHGTLLMRIVHRHYAAIFMYDGDPAGWKGSEAGAAKVRAMGTKAVSACAPIGLDPKDMKLREIHNYLEEVCRTLIVN